VPIVDEGFSANDFPPARYLTTGVTSWEVFSGSKFFSFSLRFSRNGGSHHPLFRQIHFPAKNRVQSLGGLFSLPLFEVFCDFPFLNINGMQAIAFEAYGQYF